MSLRAVIFDLFGTLVDNFSVAEHRKVLGEMAEAVGAPAEEFAGLWMDTFGQRAAGAFSSVEGNIEYVCTALGVVPDQVGVANAARMRFELTQRSLGPRRDAVETLTQLRARRLKIGLISDCSAEVPALWPRTAFAPLVHAAVFSCQVRVKKPDPRIYLLACDRLGVKPEECLYVGDGSSRELSGAAAVGMKPVMVRVPYETTEATHRVDAEEWEGGKISALTEVVGLL